MKTMADLIEAFWADTSNREIADTLVNALQKTGSVYYGIRRYSPDGPERISIEFIDWPKVDVSFRFPDGDETLSYLNTRDRNPRRDDPRHASKIIIPEIAPQDESRSLE